MSLNPENDFVYWNQIYKNNEISNEILGAIYHPREFFTLAMDDENFNLYFIPNSYITKDPSPSNIPLIKTHPDFVYFKNNNNIIPDEFTPIIRNILRTINIKNSGHVSDIENDSYRKILTISSRFILTDSVYKIFRDYYKLAALNEERYLTPEKIFFRTKLVVYESSRSNNIKDEILIGQLDKNFHLKYKNQIVDLSYLKPILIKEGETK